MEKILICYKIKNSVLAFELFPEDYYFKFKQNIKYKIAYKNIVYRNIQLKTHPGYFPRYLYGKVVSIKKQISVGIQFIISKVDFSQR